MAVEAGRAQGGGLFAAGGAVSRAGAVRLGAWGGGDIRRDFGSVDATFWVILSPDTQDPWDPPASASRAQPWSGGFQGPVGWTRFRARDRPGRARNLSGGEGAVCRPRCSFRPDPQPRCPAWLACLLHAGSGGGGAPLQLPGAVPCESLGGRGRPLQGHGKVRGSPCLSPTSVRAWSPSPGSS